MAHGTDLICERCGKTTHVYGVACECAGKWQIDAWNKKEGWQDTGLFVKARTRREAEKKAESILGIISSWLIAWK